MTSGKSNPIDNMHTTTAPQKTPYQRENTRITNATFAAVIRYSGGNPDDLPALSAATRAAVYRYQHGIAPFAALRRAVTAGDTTERDAAQTMAAEIIAGSTNSKFSS